MENQNFINVQENEIELGFWEYHLFHSKTKQRLVFDVLFGIVFPILCFIFDPKIFESNNRESSDWIDLSKLKFLVYTFCTLSMISLIIWLVFEKKLGSYANIVGGLLWSASAGAFLIGIAILPLALIGLLILIGIFGFIPFITAFVYLRNGIHAFKSASRPLTYSNSFATLILSFGLMIGISAFAHVKCSAMLSQSMLLIVSVQPNDTAIKQLKYLASISELDLIVRRYGREKNPAVRLSLADSYYRITGKYIEERLHYLES